MSHKVYFASDLHLGAPNPQESRDRERKFVAWLEEVGADATEIHLLGDIFDFWFEYGKSIPKGGARVMGAITKLTDSGIPVHFHIGNRDLWTFGYLEDELGVTLHRKPITMELDGLKCYIAHGDGLGPGEYSYKLLKKIYNNRLCQWLFKILHPDLGISLARVFIKKKHFQTRGVSSGELFVSEENEILHAYCKDQFAKDPSINCFIMGHRHLPLDLEVSVDGVESKSRYVNIGDWTSHFSWASIDDGKLELHK